MELTNRALAAVSTLAMVIVLFVVPGKAAEATTPGKIQDAMVASLNVLRNIAHQPITQRELLRAKRTLITRHDSDLKVG